MANYVLVYGRCGTFPLNLTPSFFFLLDFLPISPRASRHSAPPLSSSSSSTPHTCSEYLRKNPGPCPRPITVADGFFGPSAQGRVSTGVHARIHPSAHYLWPVQQSRIRLLTVCAYAPTIRTYRSLHCPRAPPSLITRTYTLHTYLFREHSQFMMALSSLSVSFVPVPPRRALLVPGGQRRTVPSNERRVQHKLAVHPFAFPVHLLLVFSFLVMSRPCVGDAPHPTAKREKRTRGGHSLDLVNLAGKPVFSSPGLLFC